MFFILRRLRRDERGQALVIGAVTMLILAVSVMASVSIGHGVYEKIKLQDAADAQAYSFAVKEARAYNFLAYTNRAMIVHYSAMLTVMSYVSHAVYLDRTVGAAASVLKVVPVIGAIFAAVEQAIKLWKTVVETVSQVLIPFLSALNVAFWLAQEAMLYGTLHDLVMYRDDVKKTDPNAKPGFDVVGSGGDVNLDSLFSNYDVNHSNLKNFLHAIDDGPHSSQASFSALDPTGLVKRSKLLRANSLSDPDMAKYRLLMGNLANGVRREWTAVGKGPFLIGRRWNFNLCLIIGQLRINKVADSQIKSFDEEFQNNRKDQLFASDDIKIEARAGCFGLFDWETLFELRFRAAADAQRGYHQEYGGSKVSRHHNWIGLTPFLTSDTSFVNPWQNHFSYPCNVSVLTKNMMPHSKDGVNSDTPFQLHNLISTAFMKESASNRYNDYREGVQAGYLDMSWNFVGGLDDSTPIGASARQFRERTGGMMAMAVGRAIYHRPGQWKEEPNFFNPLWTARLAPAKTHWEEKAMKDIIPEWNITANGFKDALNY
ncbi:MULTISPECIES: TadE/TadG family type IV pilus assembly protein [Myxococcus]|uniref:TadE/TadG family type IV pilus assembly protein n=1 Tax=Myxococcus TaxID=32 RepID=UPI0013D34476|nr:MULTISPECIES: pilus assembly protein [Myxococcus]NVJ26838.1 pilus assembly protein [Myxococcus sp. AM011]